MMHLIKLVVALFIFSTSASALGVEKSNDVASKQMLRRAEDYYAAEEEPEEEVEYYEEIEVYYYNETDSNSTSFFNWKEYSTQVTNKVNEDILPEGFYVTETQLLFAVGGLVVLFAGAIYLITKKTGTDEAKEEPEYIRSDLIKNEAGVTA